MHKTLEGNNLTFNGSRQGNVDIVLSMYSYTLNVWINQLWESDPRGWKSICPICLMKRGFFNWNTIFVNCTNRFTQIENVISE